MTTQAPPTDDKKRPPWSVAGVIRSSNDYMRGLNLPQMKRPTGLGAEYEFPNKPVDLTMGQLGLIQLRLTGYLSFVKQELGRQYAELGSYEEVYKVLLGLAMHEESKRHDTRVLRDVIEALAIHNDNDLNLLHKQLIERKHRIKLLQAQHDVYAEQLARLSREQSRREAEANLVRG